jgi:hypothetical protein
MTSPHPHARPTPDDDYQEHEARYFARHARPPGGSHDQAEYDPDFDRWRQDHLQAMDEDYRAWRQDRRQKFGEAFDAYRASRPARSGAAGSHTTPPSEGTAPGQPFSAAPGASGKNK